MFKHVTRFTPKVETIANEWNKFVMDRKLLKSLQKCRSSNTKFVEVGEGVFVQYHVSLVSSIPMIQLAHNKNIGKFKHITKRASSYLAQEFNEL